MKKISKLLIILTATLFAYDFGNIPQILAKDIQPRNKPMIILVGKTECIWCESMAPQLKEIKEEYPETLIYYVNTDRDISWAIKNNISELPVEIFYDKDGKELGRNLGYLGKNDIMILLEESGVLVK